MPGLSPIPALRPPPAADARARILAAVRSIPRGQVACYGEVASRAGLPGHARLAARVLSENDDPSLPWHRVLRADGRIAFAPGSREWREQARRLQAEGVDVRDGRVALRARTLDATLWGPDAG
jgi:methylated-DNA-protein-cysteine methyltransferase related protein